MRIDLDVDQLLCGAVDTPFDDHFAQITVPILHVGAKGGIGPGVYASTTFTASRDVTTITVQRLSDADEAMDFGHEDTVLAGGPRHWCGGRYWSGSRPTGRKSRRNAKRRGREVNSPICHR